VGHVDGYDTQRGKPCESPTTVLFPGVHLTLGMSKKLILTVALLAIVLVYFSRR
jgi:hypothetical protein